MRPVEFEPTVSAGERPHNDALNRAATGTGIDDITACNFVAPRKMVTVSFPCQKFARPSLLYYFTKKAQRNTVTWLAVAR
jgi:hypothetical protein